jgi:hypothetical protein
VVREPFAAINADDFYGRGSFEVLGKFLKDVPESRVPTFAMVGFPLTKTLSEHGTVARGVCVLGPGKALKKVVERTQIGHAGRSIHYLDENGKKYPLKASQTVSMNMWGFTPELFRLLDGEIVKFLKARGDEPKSEFLIPRVVDQALAEKKVRVKVLPTKSDWFGVTYPDDKDMVQARIQKLIAQRAYPAKPWA